MNFKEPIIHYEDKQLIIAEKPSGISSVETKNPKREHFYGLLQKYLNFKNRRETYLAAHHRLDFDTSGLLLFCKKKSLNKKVSELFAEKQIKKTYIAKCLKVIDRPIHPRWKIENFLKKTAHNKILMMEEVKRAGQKAITHFERIQEGDNQYLIKAYPKTGRMHQIRVHLANHGLPILGDNTYCREKVEKLAPRLMLHAHALEFKHPLTEENIYVESTPPDEFFKFSKT